MPTVGGPSTALRLSLIAAALASASLARAQTLGEMATGEVRASVIRPIALTEEYTLDFGEITAGDRASTVTLSPQSALTTSDAQTLSGGGQRAGQFLVRGQSRRAFNVTLPDQINLNGSAQTLRIDRLSYRLADSASDGGTGQLDASGAQRFTVGGVLELPARPRPGRYSGTYAVTVAYQ